MLLAMGPLARGGQIEPGQRLARPGHPSDETDDFPPLQLCHVDGIGYIVPGTGQVLGACLGTRNLLDIVASIEGLGRLNYRRCRVVATGNPLRWIDRGCFAHPARG